MVYAALMTIVVWVKSAAGTGSLYRSQHALICVFKSGTGRHTNNIAFGKNKRSRTNVWRDDRAGKGGAFQAVSIRDSTPAG